MSDINLTLVVSATILVLTNLVKYLRAKDWNGVLSTLLPWAIAVGALWLAGQTRWAENTTFAGVALRSVSVADLIVLGLLASGVAGVTYKLFQAIDGTRTSATPTLLPGPAEPRPAAKPVTKS